MLLSLSMMKLLRSLWQWFAPCTDHKIHR
jgi:hypothetical protein